MAPPLKIDRYEVLGQLGKGANGIVYLAKDPRVGREVAIKVINPDRVRDAIVQQRFHREAKAIARLHHGNIMQLLDYSGPDAKVPYLVVERLHGKNLDDGLIERGQPLDAATAAAVMHEVCMALQHAHKLSIVHRDLKPENVFLEPDGRVVLCDFGIARSFSQEETGTLAGHNTRLAGSPLYMSPEQVAAPQTVNAQSDIFALGSLFYFLLTLKHAFIADSVVNVLKRIVSGVPQQLRESRPGLPERVYRVIDKMQQRAPEKRYSSMGALADSMLLIIREAGHSDPHKALRTLLQQLGRQSAQMSQSQVIAVESMDEEAKTVVMTIAPKGDARRPTQVKQESKVSVTQTVPAKRKAKTSKGNDRTPLMIAGGIVLLAVITSVALIVMAMLRPPKTPPQTLNTGTLRLSVQPTAEVFVDDRKLGPSATLGPMPLPPGTHRLRLEHPKLGRFDQTIEINAGADTVVNLDLKKK